MCEHFQIYGQRKAGSRHTDACRSRLISRFGQTTAGSARLQTWSDRVDQTIADRIEYEDKRLVEASQPRPDKHDEIKIDDDRAPTSDHYGSRMGTLPPADEPATAKPTPTGELRQDRQVKFDDVPTVIQQEHKGPDDDDNMNDDGEELAGGSMDMGFLGSLEPSFHDEVSSLLLSQLGGTSYNKSQSYGRE